MDDANVSQVKFHSSYQSNPVAEPKVNPNKKSDNPLTQNIQQISAEVFKKVDSQAAEYQPFKLQDLNYHIQEMELDEDDDENLKELMRIEKETSFIAANVETKSTERSIEIDQASQDLIQDQQKTSQKEKEYDTSSHLKTDSQTNKSAQMKEVGQAEAANSKALAMKALIEQSYVFRAGKGIVNAGQLAEQNKNAFHALGGQIAFRFDPSSGIVYIPKQLQKEFNSGGMIKLPNNQGIEREHLINNVVVMDHEEYAMFRENLTVALQQVMDAPVVHEMPEHGKKERKDKEAPYEQVKPLDARRNNKSEAVVNKQDDRGREFRGAERTDQTTSPSQKMKKEMEKLEKALEMKYQKTLEAYKKEDLKEQAKKEEILKSDGSKSETDFFTHKESLRGQFNEAAEIKIGIVNEEILSVCKAMQEDENVSPQEKEKYRKIEVKVKEVVANFSRNIGSRENPVGEKVKALKEFFEQVSTFVIEIQGSSANFNRITPKSR